MAKKIKQNKDEEAMDSLAQLAQLAIPAIVSFQEKNLPVIKRAQWLNFIIMITLTLGVIILGYLKVIDSSAVTGLLGAIIGYVFGHIYGKKN